jgi:hypothetical protein
MTKENIVKIYNYFNFLAKGDFKESDFEKEFGKGVNAGYDKITKLNSVRRNLIISDAKKNIEKLERKFPYLKKSETKPTKSEDKK